MRKHWIAGLVGAAVAALATTWLVAQPISQNTLSGAECWNAGQGAGGPSAGFVCADILRNSTHVTALSAVSGNMVVGSTTNVTLVSGSSWGQFPSAGGTIIITAQPSAATITMPPNPVSDGADVKICNGTNSAFATNAVTVQANSNQTMVPTGAAVTLTTLAAATCVEYQFVLANTSWYKAQ